MKNKTRIVIAFVLFAAFLILFLMWFINKQQNEKQYNEDLANRFDQGMLISAPLLSNVADAMILNIQQLEKNATIANHLGQYNDFHDSFIELNQQSLGTPESRFISSYQAQFRMFITSRTYGFLAHGGKLREKESQAFMQLVYEISEFIDEDWDYDSLMIVLGQRKEKVLEAQKMISAYPNTGDIDAWRFPEFDDHQIFTRYYSRKNWPFTFLNKKRR